MLLNVGVAGAPAVGPAKKAFADCVLRVAVKVPVVMTGLPLTLNRGPEMERPTLDVRAVELIMVSPPTLEMTMACPATSVEVTAPAPWPMYISSVARGGRSSGVSALNEGAPADPLGEAKIVFAL